jgi:hypothetical protein
MFELTIFKNTFDNKTHRTMSFPSWSKLEKFLIRLSTEEGRKGGNNSSALISPAVYIEDSTRSNKNVVRWGSWCAVDVDDFDIHTGKLDHHLQSICGSYTFLCYSTASSTPNHPKFRLVFPLTRAVDNKDIPHFWYALNKYLGDIGDKQTKDLSRMYYVPAQYPEAFNFIFSNDNEIMNPDDMMSKYEYARKSSSSNFLDRLPEGMRQQVIQYRKEQLQNTDITWTSYRDCPFFPKRLAVEYMSVSKTGWYAKMFQIMVAVAGNAVKANYPITAKEIATLCSELDKETGNWYNNRPFELEANSALEYIYRS